MVTCLLQLLMGNNVDFFGSTQLAPGRWTSFLTFTVIRTPHEEESARHFGSNHLVLAPPDPFFLS
ncbi:Uncharacterized protein DAT39_017058, partial [Clarias magur]